MPSAPSPRILGHSDFGDADVSRAPGKFFFTILYIFYTTLMFYRYHNDKEPPPPPQ